MTIFINISQPAPYIFMTPKGSDCVMYHNPSHIVIEREDHSEPPLSINVNVIRESQYWLTCSITFPSGVDVGQYEYNLYADTNGTLWANGRMLLID